MVPMTTSRCFFDGEEHGCILDDNMERNVARYLNVSSTFITQHALYSSYSTILWNHFNLFQIESTFCPFFYRIAATQTCLNNKFLWTHTTSGFPG